MWSPATAPAAGGGETTRAERRRDVFWLSALLAIAGIAAWPALIILPNRFDSAYFVWIGERMLAGQLPYRDIWDNKLPPLYWINELAAWSGEPYLALYLIQFALLGLSARLLQLLVQPQVGAAAAGLAAITYLLAATVISILDTGNLTENWAAPLLIVFVYGMLRQSCEPRASSLWPLLSGAALALAVCFRPPAVVIGLVVLGFVPALRSRLLPTIVKQLAAAASVAAVVVGWAWARGVLGAMLTLCVTHNLQLSTEPRPPWATWDNVIGRIWDLTTDLWIWHVLALGGLALCWVAKPPRDRRPATDLRWTALIWYGLAVLSALPNLRLYPHYYYLTLAPLALFTAWAWRALLDHASGRHQLIAIGLMVIAVVAMGSRQRANFEAARGERDFFGAIAKAIGFLRTHGTAADSLFVFGWGQETDIYAELGWRSPTRHPMAFFYPELGSHPTLLAQWKRELLADPPTWLVCMNGPADSRDLLTGDLPQTFGWSSAAAARQLLQETRSALAPRYRLSREEAQLQRGKILYTVRVYRLIG